MKSRGKKRWLIALALVAVTITTMIFTSRKPNSIDPEMSGLVTIELDEDQPESGDRVDFVITNKGKHVIQFPDTWYILFDDGSFNMLSMPLFGNFRLFPGKSENLPVTRPQTTRPWRLGVTYLVEDRAFEVKVAVDASPMGKHVPTALTQVRGQNDISDWIDPKIP